MQITGKTWRSFQGWNWNRDVYKRQGDTIVNRDITDVTDIMVEFMKEQYGQYEEEDHRE